jgi:hypothetical protein
VAIVVSRSGAAATLEAADAVIGTAMGASRDALVRRAVYDHHAFVYRLLRRMARTRT